ncbi:MAG TPA: divalent metal cation transporter [Acetobacteraceae bacterium]|nr:divalent metal cation transporter [Acetobacteraceae bacterium]
MEPFSKEQAFSTKPAAESTRRFLTVFGPGLVVMLADSDVGSIITAGQSGVEWGYRLLGLQILLIPVLYVVQELTVRLGIFTGRGHGELVREVLGPAWPWITLAGLTVATIGALLTELSGVAGIGELYGLPSFATLPLAALGLCAIVLTGSYRRAERIAIAIGLFEVAFFFVAWAARPDMHELLSGSFDIACGDKGYLYLAAANIGSVVMPWMIFYQQSAVADKKLLPEHYSVARFDTAIGAIVTQLVMCAVTIACAATLRGQRVSLGSVGDMSGALTPFLGIGPGRIVFSAGVLGAGMVAAIICSLGFAWGWAKCAGTTTPLSSILRRLSMPCTASSSAEPRSWSPCGPTWYH